MTNVERDGSERGRSALHWITLPLLRSAPDGLLHMWPVARRVGSPRNNEPELLEPIATKTALCGLSGKHSCGACRPVFLGNASRQSEGSRLAVIQLKCKAKIHGLTR